MSGDLPDIGSVETTQLDGLQIRFARTWRADGIPVLLTSPWPESIYAFRDVLFETGRLNPLIAIDLPGYGRSEGRPDVMSPEGMGAFILNAAEHFGIKRMHAIGPDVGTPALWVSVRMTRGSDPGDTGMLQLATAAKQSLTGRSRRH